MTRADQTQAEVPDRVDALSAGVDLCLEIQLHSFFSGLLYSTAEVLHSTTLRWFSRDVSHLPVLVLHDETVHFSSGLLGKAFLCHLTALFDTPLQQEALVSFEQLQLVSLLQLLFPEQTAAHMSSSAHSHYQGGINKTSLT